MYPKLQLNFYNYNQDNIKYSDIYYASYKIGCFSIENKHLCKQDFRLIGLQEIGLSQEKIRSNTNIEALRRQNKKQDIKRLNITR